MADRYLKLALNVAALEDGAVCDILAVAANEAAGSNEAADDLKAVTEYLAGENLHGNLVEVCGYVVSLDASLLQKLEVVNRGLEISLTDTVDGESNAVLAGIKLSVLAGAIVLELKTYVAVIEAVYVLGLTCVNLFHKLPPKFCFLMGIL